MDKDLIDLDFLLPPTVRSPAPTSSDDWELVGLTGQALEIARLWSKDLEAFSQAGAPAWQQRCAATLRQVLDEVRADPHAFNRRAAT